MARRFSESALHAATVGLAEDYYDRRRELGPVDPQVERERFMGTEWHETRGFADGHYPHGSRFWRIVNELPTIAMIAIVVLVIVKPF